MQLQRLNKNQNVDRDKLNIFYEQYQSAKLRSFLDDGLDFDIFTEIMNNVASNWDTSIIPLQQLFTAFDKNGDESIDFEELISTLVTLYNGTVEEKMKICFSCWDLNHDCIITVDEFEALCKQFKIPFAEIAPKLSEQARNFGVSIEEFTDTIIPWTNVITTVLTIPNFPETFFPCNPESM